MFSDFFRHPNMLTATRLTVHSAVQLLTGILRQNSDRKLRDYFTLTQISALKRLHPGFAWFCRQIPASTSNSRIMV